MILFVVFAIIFKYPGSILEGATRLIGGEVLQQDAMPNGLDFIVQLHAAIVLLKNLGKIYTSCNRH